MHMFSAMHNLETFHQVRSLAPDKAASNSSAVTSKMRLKTAKATLALQQW